MLFQHDDASIVNIGADWLPILNQKQLHCRQQHVITGTSIALTIHLNMQRCTG